MKKFISVMSILVFSSFSGSTISCGNTSPPKHNPVIISKIKININWATSDTPDPNSGYQWDDDFSNIILDFKDIKEITQPESNWYVKGDKPEKFAFQVIFNHNIQKDEKRGEFSLDKISFTVNKKYWNSATNNIEKRAIASRLTSDYIVWSSLSSYYNVNIIDLKQGWSFDDNKLNSTFDDVEIETSQNSIN